MSIGVIALIIGLIVIFSYIIIRFGGLYRRATRKK